MSGVHTDLGLCSLTPLTFTSVPVMYVKAVTDYSPPPPGRQGRPDSDWWASLTFVSDMQRRPEVPFIWRVTGGPGESRCGGRSLVLLMYILWSGHQLHDMSDSRARSLRLGQDVNAAPQELREEIGNSINDYWI